MAFRFDEYMIGIDSAEAASLLNARLDKFRELLPNTDERELKRMAYWFDDRSTPEAVAARFIENEKRAKRREQAAARRLKAKSARR